MELIAEDIVVHSFVPDDGSSSSAIKVQHRTTRQEYSNSDTDSQRENMRRAMRQLIEAMNPNPDLIPQPILLPFDRVRVKLPESTHDGLIERISWDFPREEWKYFVQCGHDGASSWYADADLQPADD